MAITLELSAAEALMILDPIQDKALTAQVNAARHSGEAREIAELTATICGRVATSIVDQLYPEHNARWQARLDEAEMGLA